MLELCLFIFVTRAVYEIVKMINPNLFTKTKKKIKEQNRYEQSKKYERRIQINTQYLKKEKDFLSAPSYPSQKSGLLHELMKPCRVDLHRASEMKSEKEREKAA